MSSGSDTKPIQHVAFTSPDNGNTDAGALRDYCIVGGVRRCRNHRFIQNCVTHARYDALEHALASDVEEHLTGKPPRGHPGLNDGDGPAHYVAGVR